MRFLPDVKPEDAVSDEVSLRRSPQDALTVIESVAEQVLHDIRNIILPLTVQVDLAVEATRQDPAARAALADAQESCRQCGERLERLETVTDPGWNPAGDLDVRDLFERMRLILRYALPDVVTVDIDAPTDLPRLDVPLGDIQGVMFNAATGPIGHSLVRLALRAATDDDAVCITVELEYSEPVPPSSLEEARGAVRTASSSAARHEVEGAGLHVRIRTWWPACVAPSAGGRDHGGRRVLLLHGDALRRGLIRSHLTQRGLIVSTDPDADEVEVAIVDHARATDARDDLPRVVLGAESEEGSGNTVSITAPYSLDDVFNAAVALISPDRRTPQEPTP